jgi:hypothetical protein
MQSDPSAKPQLLFLDFDGVLHPVGERAFDENFRLIANPGLFVWRPILEQILVPFPSVRIVVSSDWRRLFDDENLIRLLGPLGNRFAGVVETGHRRPSKRGRGGKGRWTVSRLFSRYRPE